MDIWNSDMIKMNVVNLSRTDPKCYYTVNKHVPFCMSVDPTVFIKTSLVESWQVILYQTAETNFFSQVQDITLLSGYSALR